jgi:hypothetical protein
MSDQVGGSCRARRQGPVRRIVDLAQPPPADFLSYPAGAVGAGVGGQVGGVHGDDRHAQVHSRSATARTEHEGASEVYQVRSVIGDRGSNCPAGQADPESGIYRNAD